MDNQKQKLPGASDQLLLKFQNMFTKSPLLVICYLSKFDVIKAVFWVITKMISANICKKIHDIINYSTAISPFESGKCGKERKKYKNLNILRTKEAF